MGNNTSTSVPREQSLFAQVNGELPPDYRFAHGEKFVPCDPGELAPSIYYVGHSAPVLEEEDFLSGEPVYWFDLRHNVMKRAEVVEDPTTGARSCAKWIETTEIPKYVVNFVENEPMTCYGKIIGSSLSKHPRVSFRAVMDMVKGKRAPEEEPEE
jgi:hypothetical protein